MAKYQLDVGVKSVPVKAFVYGVEGIGKSTLAAQMPNPVFIDIEGGTNQLPVARFPRPTSWTMLLDEVREVRNGSVPCSTLVIDTADAAENLCVAHVCAKDGKDGLEAFGYGRGYVFLVEEFARLVDLLTEVTEHGTSVFVLGHARLEKFERPDESGAYDRFAPKLTDTKKASVSALLKEWCDMLLFLDYKIYVTKDKNDKAKASGGARVIRTTHSPQWDAKNRFGLPDEMPLDFASAERIASLLAGGEALRADSGADAPIVDQTPTLADSAPNSASQQAQTAPETPTEGDRRTAVPNYVTMLVWPERMQALADLCERDGVSEDELRRAVASKGYFPEECPASEYPADFAAWLPTVWDSFLKQVETLRIEPPFYSNSED